MNIFIQTRDVYKDYTFLGNEPQNWWAKDYAHYSSFEHPTVILESEGNGWRLYLSGAKCSRVDNVNTPIRYSFVLSSQDKIAEQDLDLVLSLIQCWLQAIDESVSDQLKQRLDGLFDEDKISQYIALKQDKTRDMSEIDQEISSRFQLWLNQSTSISINEIDIEQSKIGAVQSNDVQVQFLNYCAKILKGETQDRSALYLNFIETQNELESVKISDENEYPRQFMILVNDTDNILKDQLKEVNIKKKVEPIPSYHLPANPETNNTVLPLKMDAQTHTENLSKKKNCKLVMILAVIGAGGILLYLISR